MERTNRDQLVGSIFKGKIKNLEPSLQAAFVDIGCGKNAFLHYWDMLPAMQDMLEDGEDDADSDHENDRPQQPAPQPQNAVQPASQMQNATQSRKQRSKHQRNGVQQQTAPQPQLAQQESAPPKKGFLARILDFFARRKETPSEVVTQPVTQPAADAQKQ
ncbi:MAG: hypothetical protein J6T46_04370, partial [Victivallales bacterium]|nr:hypothetical protein [Victivallales bacterium]